MKGKHHSEEAKVKISSKRLGTHRTEESKQKQSLHLMGPLNGNYGKPRSKETIEKHKKSNTKIYINFKDKLYTVYEAMKIFNKSET